MNIGKLSKPRSLLSTRSDKKLLFPCASRNFLSPIKSNQSQLHIQQLPKIIHTVNVSHNFPPELDHRSYLFSPSTLSLPYSTSISTKLEIIIMAPKSSLPQTNYAGIQSAADATGCFQQIVLFMNNSNLKIPIIATPLINMDRLDQFWKTAKNQGTEEVPSVDFKIDGKEYTLIVTHINEAFGTTVAENESFADLANDTLSKFFLYIGYAGLVPDKNSTKWYPTSEMDNRYMRKEWNMLFDAMVKIFSTKTSGWNGIPSYIKKLTHSMVHGYKVNVGKVVMAQLRSSISKKVHVYPRFVTMLLNHICDIVENAPNMKECFVLKNNTQTSLIL